MYNAIPSFTWYFAFPYVRFPSQSVFWFSENSITCVIVILGTELNKSKPSLTDVEEQDLVKLLNFKKNGYRLM